MSHGQATRSTLTFSRVIHFTLVSFNVALEGEGSREHCRKRRTIITAWLEKSEAPGWSRPPDGGPEHTSARARRRTGKCEPASQSRSARPPHSGRPPCAG